MCTEAELAPYLNMNYRHATDSHITEEK
jgi:hypothetical protein